MASASTVRTRTAPPIDSSGTFDKKSYTNLIELQQILRDSPSAPKCVAAARL